MISASIFKAILSCFLLIFLSLKLGTFYHLPGHLGQGLKIGIVLGKSGHFAGLVLPKRKQISLLGFYSPLTIVPLSWTGKVVAVFKLER